jgi:5'-deoxynucleotidase YfbR-like HD superfamily hydrolase
MAEQKITEAFSRLTLLYDSGFVERMHTVPTNRTHTVAEHVYGSLLIAMEICKFHKMTPGPILETLLYHDAPEVWTGDIPAPIKRVDEQIRERLDILEAKFYKSNGIGLRELGPSEHIVVKASDTLDLAFTCFHERRRGNRHPRLAEVFGNCMVYLKDWSHLEAVALLTQAILEEWTYAGAL